MQELEINNIKTFYYIHIMSLIKDYFIKTKIHIQEFGEQTIVLLQNGAFFEVYGLKNKKEVIYGSNIIDFSRICDLNIVDKKNSGICYCYASPQ